MDTSPDTHFQYSLRGRKEKKKLSGLEKLAPYRPLNPAGPEPRAAVKYPHQVQFSEQLTLGIKAYSDQHKLLEQKFSLIFAFNLSVETSGKKIPTPT